MGEPAECKRMLVEAYTRLCAFDSTHHWEPLRMSFIARRPTNEPGFMLARHEEGGRNIRCETRAYVMETPEGTRYS
jgi:ribulose-bisphosphate carboxylase small chain